MAIHYLIENEKLDIVFSHFHAVDLEEHQFIKHLADRPFNKQPVEAAEKWMEDLYAQTDYYLGKFLHFLDKGWMICIFSDHGQVAPAHEIPLFMEGGAVTVPWMEKMGYTVPIRNEQGEVIDLDWTRTKAVMLNYGHIYLNIKGRNKHLVNGVEIDGIVDPKDQ